MKSTDLGYVLFSALILDEMKTNMPFAESVGRAINEHLNKELHLGICPTQYGLILVLTELDKNNMPRTSVTFREEGGNL